MPEDKQKVVRPRDPQTGRFIIFDNEQEKHVKALEEKLTAVCSLFSLPIDSPTLSTDDFNSNLRDAYDAAMRADAETLYAPIVAERDRLKATLETERADAAAKVALLQKRCRFIQLAGHVCITLGCFATYLACKFLGVAK